jgi:hypothetical protein
VSECIFPRSVKTSLAAARFQRLLEESVPSAEPSQQSASVPLNQTCIQPRSRSRSRPNYAVIYPDRDAVLSRATIVRAVTCVGPRSDLPRAMPQQGVQCHRSCEERRERERTALPVDLFAQVESW